MSDSYQTSTPEGPRETCGEHGPLRDLCFRAEAPWRELVGASAIQTPDDFPGRVELTSDLCVVDGEHFFIRGGIELKILDTPDVFVWDVWCSLSRESFESITTRWAEPGRVNDEPRFGWLMTDLPGYPGGTMHLKTMVHQREPGRTPWIEVEPVTLLGRECHDGITAERWRELVLLAKSSAPVTRLPPHPPGVMCSCCGGFMEGLHGVEYSQPDPPTAGASASPERVVIDDRTCLRTRTVPNWRRWGGEVLMLLTGRGRLAPSSSRYFVRAALVIPITDATDATELGYTLWVRVDRAGFETYRSRTADGLATPLRGTLANEIAGFAQSLGLEVEAPLDPDPLLRPRLRVPGEHALAKAQREGVTKVRAWELVAQALPHAVGPSS